MRRSPWNHQRFTGRGAGHCISDPAIYLSKGRGGRALDHEIIIIGAGLAGLTAAHVLDAAGRDVHVVEARSRLGGRIQSAADTNGTPVGDLGPSWVWPESQPVAAAWIERLGQGVFAQFQTGATLLDRGPGAQIEARRIAGQDGTCRITGGPTALIDALAGRLENHITPDSPVTAIRIHADHVAVITTTQTLKARKVVVAIPPRLAGAAIKWKPELSPQLFDALQATPTWMAPHAKVLATFARPIWKDRGLSGRIVSAAGPLAEAHDLSGPKDNPAALYGFIGWPFKDRAAHPNLHQAIADQLDRVLGVSPDAIHITDWAAEPYTAHAADLTGPMTHPTIGPSVLRVPAFDGHIVFAASETADQSPGLIEGAFVAGGRAAQQVSA